jgi:hypothetical protein
MATEPELQYKTPAEIWRKYNQARVKPIFVAPLSHSSSLGHESDYLPNLAHLTASGHFTPQGWILSELGADGWWLHQAHLKQFRTDELTAKGLGVPLFQVALMRAMTTVSRVGERGLNIDDFKFSLTKTQAILGQTTPHLFELASRVEQFDPELWELFTRESYDIDVINTTHPNWMNRRGGRKLPNKHSHQAIEESLKEVARVAYCRALGMDPDRTAFPYSVENAWQLIGNAGYEVLYHRELSNLDLKVSFLQKIPDGWNRNMSIEKLGEPLPPLQREQHSPSPRHFPSPIPLPRTPRTLNW